jgi:sensor domain CHASE-containing protein
VQHEEEAERRTGKVQIGREPLVAGGNGQKRLDGVVAHLT